jgi:hypothetical protein
MSMLSILCIMLAFLLFVIGGWSRWWVADVRGPYYPVLLSSALAFLVLGVWLIPLMVK